MITMWSVKCRPKPGAARMAARSDSGSGFDDGVWENSRDMLVTLSEMVGSPTITCG